MAVWLKTLLASAVLVLAIIFDAPATPGGGVPAQAATSVSVVAQDDEPGWLSQIWSVSLATGGKIVSTVAPGTGAAFQAAGDIVDEEGAGAVAQAVGSKFWDATIGKITQAFIEGHTQLFQSVLTLWMGFDFDPRVGGDAIVGVRNIVMVLTAAALVISIIVGGVRLAAERQRGLDTGLSDIGAVILRLAVATALVPLITVTGMTLADSLANEIMAQFGPSDIGLLVMLSEANGLEKLFGPVLVLIIIVIGMLGSLTQFVALAVRFLIVPIAAGLAPLFAAGSATTTGKAGLTHLYGYLAAAVVYKPVAALLYVMVWWWASGLAGGSDDEVTNNSEGVAKLLVYVMIGLVGFSAPALVRLVAPVAAPAAGSSGSAAAGAVGAAAGLASGAISLGAAAFTGGASMAASGLGAAGKAATGAAASAAGSAVGSAASGLGAAAGSAGGARAASAGASIVRGSGYGVFSPGGLGQGSTQPKGALSAQEPTSPRDNAPSSPGAVAGTGMPSQGATTSGFAGGAGLSAPGESTYSGTSTSSVPSGVNSPAPAVVSGAIPLSDGDSGSDKEARTTSGAPLTAGSTQQETSQPGQTTRTSALAQGDDTGVPTAGAGLTAGGGHSSTAPDISKNSGHAPSTGASPRHSAPEASGSAGGDTHPVTKEFPPVGLSAHAGSGVGSSLVRGIGAPPARTLGHDGQGSVQPGPVAVGTTHPGGAGGTPRPPALAGGGGARSRGAASVASTARGVGRASRLVGKAASITSQGIKAGAHSGQQLGQVLEVHGTAPVYFGQVPR